MALVFSGVRAFDGTCFWPEPTDVFVEGDILVDRPPMDAELIEGGHLFCGFVDAHVHLSLSRPAEVARGGVTGVLDLGSPLHFAISTHPPLRYRYAGPLLTSPGGYPTRSWGAEGFGLEVGTPEHGAHTTSELIDHGVSIVKVALDASEGEMLQLSRIQAIADTAHARGTKVAAHALTEEAVQVAEAAAVDVLAHTPTERLPDDLVRRLGARRVTVVSTIRAFGSRPEAIDNLRRMAESGCEIAYGTDLGNDGIDAGIDAGELATIAGLLGGDEAALATATSVSAGLAGIPTGLRPGAAADLVWLPRYESLHDLTGPKRVWIGGHEVH